MDVELLRSACAVTLAVCSSVSLMLIGCHTADRANTRKRTGNSSRRGKKGKKEKSQRSKRGKKDGSKRDKKKPAAPITPAGGAPPTKPPGSKDPAGGSQRDKKVSAEPSQKQPATEKEKDKSSRGGSKRDKKKDGSKREKKKEAEKKDEKPEVVTPSPMSPAKVEDDPDMHTAREMNSPKTTPTTPELKPAEEKEAVMSKYVNDPEGAAPVSLAPKKSNTMLEGDEKKAENSMYK